MGIFNSFFGGNPSGQGESGGNAGGNSGQGQNSGNQQNQQNQQNNQSNQNGGTGENQNVNGSDKPIDAAAIYTKMWENPANPAEPPRLRIDSKVLDEVSSKMNFMQGIDPGLMQKATNGDIQALMDIMGQVGQRAYRASIEHGSALTDSFVGQRDTYNEGNTGSAVRNELMMQDLFKGADGKPLPPYAKKQVADIAKRMQAANPDASPQEIADSTRNYMAEIAKMVSGNQGQVDSNQGQQNKEPFDWDNWAKS